MMKKSFVFLAAFFASTFLISLFSCSNNSNGFGGFDESDTLKFEANRLENEIGWQGEIEGEILSREIKKMNGIDQSRVTLTHRAVLANEKNDSFEKIYPYIEGFASLDLSGFSSDDERRKLVEEFCACLLEAKDCDSFFDKSSLFSLAVFYYDLKVVSGIDYFSAADNSESVFDSYILGAPFSGENFFSVPVRLKTGKKNLDVEIFIEEFENVWKIDEIEIRKFS